MKLIEIVDYFQMYKKIEVDRKKIEKIKRGKVQIKAYRVKSNYEIYISDKVKIKKKQFHIIQRSINKTLKLLEMEKELNLPKFIIVTSMEMQTGALAIYNAIRNSILINEVMGINKDLKIIQKNYAQYVEKYGRITVDNYVNYT